MFRWDRVSSTIGAPAYGPAQRDASTTGLASSSIQTTCLAPLSAEGRIEAPNTFEALLRYAPPGPYRVLIAYPLTMRGNRRRGVACDWL